jgi:hypothetical protein
VKLWLDNGGDVPMAERRAACRYAFFLAYLRSFQDSLHIASHDTRPVADHNGTKHNFLECIYQHCQRTKVCFTTCETSRRTESISVPFSRYLRSRAAV